MKKHLLPSCQFGRVGPPLQIKVYSRVVDFKSLSFHAQHGGSPFPSWFYSIALKPTEGHPMNIGCGWHSLFFGQVYM